MKNALHLKATKRWMARAMTLALLVIMPANNLFAQKQVKNIVLVHGAFADGSGWEGVYNLLKKKGFNVSVVANPNTSFAEDVAAAKRTIDRLEGPVLLVGHSYGGAIITEAGNSDKVVGLVYIAAFVPDAGETMLQLVQSGPPTPNSGIEPPSADGFVWYGKAKFHSGFCADLSKEKADFMYDSQVPIAASIFGATVTKAAWKTKPSWYIIATEDQTVPIEGARFMAKRANSKVTEIKASHAVYVSKAKEVADVIAQAAK
ncbi:alpha/beta fold hydrolase [Flavobacterium sp.]|uniref:alpha/beta fold hydrolase n=1 Tax=Flavobacterium sp. TaxID=239 RepID=UPI0039E2E77C